MINPNENNILAKCSLGYKLVITSQHSITFSTSVKGIENHSVKWYENLEMFKLFSLQIIKCGWLGFTLIEVVTTPTGLIDNYWGSSQLDLFTELLDSQNLLKDYKKIEKDVVMVYIISD